MHDRFVEFKEWQGDEPADSYGGKAFLDCDGVPLFAEIAVVKMLMGQGFEDAVWVDSYRRCFRNAIQGPSVGGSRPNSSSGRRRRAYALASVRRPNRACSFPAHGFHEDTGLQDATKRQRTSGPFVSPVRLGRAFSILGR